MKWMIASDIHGSAYYCEKLLEAYEKEKADRIILLGDLLYHGPRNDLPEGYDPKAVAGMLNGCRDIVFSVRGNCEAEVDQMMLDFPIMAEYAAMNVGSRLLFITHGHIWNSSHLPRLKPGDILLHGHTHVPACEEHEDHIYLNPGSVAMPKKDTRHSYLILENDTFLWKDLNMETYQTYRL